MAQSHWLPNPSILKKTPVLLHSITCLLCIVCLYIYIITHYSSLLMKHKFVILSFEEKTIAPFLRYFFPFSCFPSSHFQFFLQILVVTEGENQYGTKLNLLFSLKIPVLLLANRVEDIIFSNVSLSYR